MAPVEVLDAPEVSMQPPQLQVNRRAFRLESFNTAYRATKPPKTTLSRRFKNSVSKVTPKCVCSFMCDFFPIIDWVRHYDLKNDFVTDLVCGVTIAIFQVPQAMGYAQLAKLDPIYGLYSSFFPVLIYLLMGTSRQIAMGTFAVGSLMMGAINTKWISEIAADPRCNSSLVPADELPVGCRTIDIAVTVALWSGIFMLIFWIFQLGALSVYLSDHLVSGFTCASALHIATSQIGGLFGIKLPNESGAVALIRTYINLFERIHLTNVPTISLSIVAIVILIIFKDFVNPRLKKYIPVPFPIELCLVIAGIITSTYLDLTKYKVSIVGHIDSGIPAPKGAPTSLMGPLAVDSLILTIVLFSQTVSLGKIFAKKYGYEINANQELLTLGVANVLGSFFFCMPTGGSLSRSSVQDAVGGKTQLVSAVSCVGILIVLLALGPLLENLPNCILSAIIVVSLKEMLSQVRHLLRYWRVSKIDAAIWLITFLSVFVLDVDIGLGIGVGFSLATLIVRSQRPNTYVMGGVEHTGVYVPLQRYLVAKEVPGFKIFRFDGPLHFGNIEYFTKELARSVKDRSQSKRTLQNENPNGFLTVPNTIQLQIPITNIILDCSAIGFVDTTGVTALKESYIEYEKQGKMISLAACANSLYTMLKKDGFFDIAPTTCIFPTIQDAILFQQKHLSQVTTMNTLPPYLHPDGNSHITKL